MSKTSQNAYHAQTAEFGAAVLRGIPALTAAEMQRWIEKPADLADFLRGLNGGTKSMAHLIDLDADPKPYNGWKIDSHTKGGLLTDLSQIRLYLDPEQEGKGCIEGNKLLTKLVSKSPFNANLLDWIMEDAATRVALIEAATGVNWKQDNAGNTRYIFFHGTVYRDSNGYRCVRYLCWYDGRWQASYHWLDRGWGSQCPAAVPAS